MNSGGSESKDYVGEIIHRSLNWVQARHAALTHDVYSGSLLVGKKYRKLHRY